jgi:hypothetical protein
MPTRSLKKIRNRTQVHLLDSFKVGDWNVWISSQGQYGQLKWSNRLVNFCYHFETPRSIQTTQKKLIKVRCRNRDLRPTVQNSTQKHTTLVEFSFCPFSMVEILMDWLWIRWSDLIWKYLRGVAFSVREMPNVIMVGSRRIWVHWKSKGLSFFETQLARTRLRNGSEIKKYAIQQWYIHRCTPFC